jgi:vacuolar-type H+-ATPase subunit I/STV1
MENSKIHAANPETQANPSNDVSVGGLDASLVLASATAATTTNKNDTNKLKKFITNPNLAASTNMEYQKLDEILSRENRNNKMEIWSKLDKTQKILRLHEFADKYGQEHAFDSTDVRSLKAFFAASLDKGKLQRVKDVIYDKEKREIQAIPGLVVDATTPSSLATERHFTLRNLDAKRVSTLKSLGKGAKTPL